MEPAIATNFVERRTGRVIRGFVRKATELDLLGWATWRYKANDEDSDWDWWTIYVKSKRTRSRVECYAAIAAGQVQGLMAIHLGRARLGMLVDYLAIDPSHRGAANRLKYVGTALIGIAVLRSHERGSAGRIYLESLAGAESFYESLGMLRQPRKSRESYVVFAFDAGGAQQFLEQIKGKRILTL